MYSVTLFLPSIQIYKSEINTDQTIWSYINYQAINTLSTILSKPKPEGKAGSEEFLTFKKWLLESNVINQLTCNNYCHSTFAHVHKLKATTWIQSTTGSITRNVCRNVRPPKISVLSFARPWLWMSTNGRQSTSFPEAVSHPTLL